jgi:DNA-binding response OmpR family regulator
MVIVVDDEPTHARPLAAGFERMGLRARVFTGPRAAGYALLAAQSGAFDDAAALVLDLNLDHIHNVMHGPQLLRALRHAGVTAPACLLTGAFMDEEAASRLGVRFDCLIEKPARPGKFRPFLEPLLARAAESSCTVLDGGACPIVDTEDSAVTTLPLQVH